jgi:hypothetical protein
MTVGKDPGDERSQGESGRAHARLTLRLMEDVRHDADLARLVEVAPRRWPDALLAETRFHLAGLINALELAIGLHVTDATIEAALGQLGAGYGRRAIEAEPGLLSPALLGHLRRRAAVAMLLRQNDSGRAFASLAVLGQGSANDRYVDALAALGIAERRWSAPMLLDAPMRPDLPAEHFHDLAWTVAALLIRGAEQGTGRSDPAMVKGIAQATERLIARHDEGQGAVALAARCARSLPGELRFALAPAALIDARLLLFAALAESETGLPIDDGLDALIGARDEDRHCLLRLMRIDDAVAFRTAELLAPLAGGLGDAGDAGDAALAAFVEAYRAVTPAQAQLWLARQSSPRALSEKLALLGQGR